MNTPLPDAVASATNGSMLSRPRKGLTVTASAGEERVDLDPRLLIVSPSVVETSPAGGAVVPTGVQPTVRFSEAVDPASLPELVAWREPRPGEVASDTELPVSTTIRDAAPIVATTSGAIRAVEDGKVVGLVDRVGVLQAMALTAEEPGGGR